MIINTKSWVKISELNNLSSNTYIICNAKKLKNWITQGLIVSLEI